MLLCSHKTYSILHFGAFSCSRVQKYTKILLLEILGKNIEAKKELPCISISSSITRRSFAKKWIFGWGNALRISGSADISAQKISGSADIPADKISGSADKLMKLICGSADLFVFICLIFKHVFQKAIGRTNHLMLFARSFSLALAIGFCST